MENYRQKKQYIESPIAECSWSVGSVRLGIKGLLVRDPPIADSLCYVLEQDTLSAA